MSPVKPLHRRLWPEILRLSGELIPLLKKTVLIEKNEKKMRMGQR